VTLPVSAITALDAHRKCQDKFRLQFGPDYPHRPRFDICASRRHPVEAGLYISGRVTPASAAETAERQEPPLLASLIRRTCWRAGSCSPRCLHALGTLRFVLRKKFMLT